MAAEFARSGARVAIVARSEATLAEAVAEIAVDTGETMVSGFSCDVSDVEALEAMHAEVVAELGSVDILVNNAGTSAAMPFMSATDEIWAKDIELKLMAAVRLCRLCIPAMQEQSWGRIINVLNIGAKAPSSKSAPTSVSRAAGMALTKALAGEMAPHGILVNALNTGVLVTNQWQRMHTERAPNMSFDEFIESTGSRVPVGRMGEAREFANLACFLASDHASYVTGTSINIDGGLSPVV